MKQHLHGTCEMESCRVFCRDWGTACDVGMGLSSGETASLPNGGIQILTANRDSLSQSSLTGQASPTQHDEERERERGEGSNADGRWREGRRGGVWGDVCH